jgi:ubiquinone/menaquinone biosynthesis C-methylase UbiE
MSVREAYTHWSTSYDTDRNLTRDLDQVVTKSALGQSHYSTILELGCGTGKNTLLFSQIAERVYALDFTVSMIRQAQTKVRSNNILYVVADLTHPWPCAVHSVDLIVCNLVLEHIADLNAIFAEAHRVLVNGGRFFISELHPFKQYQGKKARFQHGEARTEIDAFVHHVSGFLDAAEAVGFRLNKLGEWWHEEDHDEPPRLISFMFGK